MSEGTRVDRWVWAVRLCKTRSEATDICRAGHVRVNGRLAKAATPVAVGDRVELRRLGRIHVVEVTRLVEARVGAPIAVECYVDHSPPPPPRDQFDLPRRDPGTGRPTKRDRRQLDRWRGGRG
ncbi:MAG TPA: RNA-binding S4 domain-containing protein [Acidimicrobiales bacterium]